jgi:hypothetical protein
MGFNDDIGYFELVLPKKLGHSTYKYNDVVVGDRVKVWYGYSSSDLTGDPDFMGKILQTGGRSGQYAIIKGKPNSEILSRRIKSRTIWVDTHADDIAATVASDLSLGASLIATNTVYVDITEDTETYADILRKLSDHWYDVSNQVKMDYYVTVNSDLYWQSRPYRTSGVETLTYGEDYIDYSFAKDGTNIKNALAVYGALTPFNSQDESIYGRKYPSDGDGWTYSAVWTGVSGTVASNSTTPKVGSTCTRLQNTSSPYNVYAYVTLPVIVHVEGINGYSVLEFYGRRHDTGEGYIRLFAPNGSHYFEMDHVSFSDSNDVWKFHRYSLGKNNEYDADSNPTGWTSFGEPSWEELSYINVECDTVSSGGSVDIDGLCFNFGRWRYAPLSDATSVSSYDESDHAIVDDNLKSDADCEKRAQTILFQNKDPVNRLDPVLLGNKNIVLGDRLTVTLEPENISAQYYYVTAVEHNFDGTNWRTIPTLVNTVNTRRVPTITDNEAISSSIKNLQQISRNQKRIN